MQKIAGILGFGLLFAIAAQADNHKGGEAGVRAALLDYVEGVYGVAPERIARSVHPDLRKHGFAYRDGEWRELPMTYEQLYRLAGEWNKDGSRANADSPKEITIYEVKEKTAVAKLVAEWGQDYFHLANYDGKWMITNVIWQSLPEEN